MKELPFGFWVTLGITAVGIYVYKDTLKQAFSAGEKLNESFSFAGGETLGTSLYNATHDDLGNLIIADDFFEGLNEVDFSNPVSDAVNKSIFPKGDRTLGTWLYDITHPENA